MIQVYRKTNSDYTKNGDFALVPSSCDLNTVLNGTWVLELDMPLAAGWREVTEDAVLAVPTFMGEKQLFRIFSVRKTEDRLQASAYPIFYDAAKETFLMDVRPTIRNGQQALDMILAGSRYTGSSNITNTSTAYFIRRNALDAICGSDSPTFLKRWGGEILYNNYQIIINRQQGSDHGVTARYGKDIAGIDYTVDLSETVTRIVPIAFNGRTMSGTEPWVDSSNINKYAVTRIKEMKFEDVKLVTDAEGTSESDIICTTQAELDAALTAKCQEQFAAGADLPRVTLDIDVALLSETQEYAGFRELEAVHLGDTVHCYHTRLDISTEARVIELTWDCIQNRPKQIRLGDYRSDFLQDMEAALRSAQGAIGDILGPGNTVLAERIRGFIDLANTQLRYQKNVAQRQDVRAILFEDTDPESPLYGALCIGSQGLQIADHRTGDGTDWDWTTAFTAKGGYLDTLVFGQLMGNRIDARNLLVEDENGNETLSIDQNGHVSLQASSFSLTGKTIGQIAQESVEEDILMSQEMAEALSGNLLKDPFGLSEDYWTLNGTLTRGKDDPDGKKNAALLVGKSGGAHIETNASNRPFSGKTAYRFSVWLKSNTTIGVKITLHSSGGDVQKTVTVTSSWQRFELGINYAGSSVSTGDIRIGGDGTVVSGYSLYIYNPRLEYASAYATQEQIMDMLTNGGETQGIYLYNGKIYVNGEYIRALVVTADMINANSLQAISASIGGFDIDSSSIFTKGVVVQGGSSVRTVEIGNRNTGYSRDLFSGNSGKVATRGSKESMTMTEGLLYQSQARRFYISDEAPYNTTDLSSGAAHYLGETSFTAGVTVSGNMTVRGTKSAARETAHYGSQILYCMETPVQMFGDCGKGVLDETGTCLVEIDDIFTEVTDTEKEYYVCLQKMGQGDCWVEETGPRFFTVKGTPGLTFIWILQAVQTGREHIRYSSMEDQIRNVGYSEPDYMDSDDGQEFLMDEEEWYET